MANEYVREIGGKVLLVTDAKVLRDGKIVDGFAAIWPEDLKQRASRGQLTSIAQCYEIVLPGMILARHIFQGLRRDLYCDGVKTADQGKFAYTRKPKVDFETARGKDGFPEAVERPCPPNKTFVVIASPNDRHRDKFPDIDIWIDHWNWAEESPTLNEAPVDWIDRYDRKIYTRS